MEEKTKKDVALPGDEGDAGSGEGAQGKREDVDSDDMGSNGDHGILVNEGGHGKESHDEDEDEDEESFLDDSSEGSSSTSLPSSSSSSSSSSAALTALVAGCSLHASSSLVATALALRSVTKHYRYPEERPIVG